jgi:hypothetical protein
VDPADALVVSLVEFYNVDQIRGFWKEAADALMSKSTCLIHITSTGFAGQNSSGMTLSTSQEISAFINACRKAIAQKEGTTTVDPASLGTGIDFSRAILQA